MSSKYSILIHASFQLQIDDFLELHSSDWGDVITQFKKLVDNPLHNPMNGLPPPLGGRVFHLHVGGRKGFRLIYVADSKRGIVLPVFLSCEIKPRFDYDAVPWQDYASEIYKDLCDGNTTKFTELRLISKQSA